MTIILSQKLQRKCSDVWPKTGGTHQIRVIRLSLLEKCSGVIHGFVHHPRGSEILKIVSVHLLSGPSFIRKRRFRYGKDD